MFLFRRILERGYYGRKIEALVIDTCLVPALRLGFSFVRLPLEKERLSFLISGR